VIAPHTEIRSLFVQKELGERQGNWMNDLEEYDIEFKTTTIVKGHGLCKLEIEAMDSKNHEEEGWKEEPVLYSQQRLYIPLLENSLYIMTSNNIFNMALLLITSNPNKQGH
jgi:hypothetical protein